MRWLVLCFAIACGPPPTPGPFYAGTVPAQPPAGEAEDPARAGNVVDRTSDFSFDGGRIEFEMRRDRDRIIEVAHNRYAVPIVMQWQMTDFENLEPTAPVMGVAILPPATAPNGEGAPVILTMLSILDTRLSYHRQMQFHARFGDPAARPTPYAYRLPYAGKTFSVLQGFHGAFSHRGSNEFAVDFDCPVATHVLATRPGIVVAANAAAPRAGTTADFLEYKRTNFVLVMHEDGTLGEYMHLSPSGVEVRPGEHVDRGTELGLSGNTGFSSTPHLHFSVMTAGDDGVSARSFPFELAVGPRRVETPIQGHSYAAWE